MVGHVGSSQSTPSWRQVVVVGLARSAGGRTAALHDIVAGFILAGLYRLTPHRGIARTRFCSSSGRARIGPRPAITSNADGFQRRWRLIDLVVPLSEMRPPPPPVRRCIPDSPKEKPLGILALPVRRTPNRSPLDCNASCRSRFGRHVAAARSDVGPEPGDPASSSAISPMMRSISLHSSMRPGPPAVSGVTCVEARERARSPGARPSGLLPGGRHASSCPASFAFSDKARCPLRTS